jgi:hypothetical protein
LQANSAVSPRVRLFHRGLDQCEIIQGRRVGKLFASVSPRARWSGRNDFPEQQRQAAPWVCLAPESVSGVDALRSLVACATLRSAGMAATYGAVRKARGASPPQFEHSSGMSKSAIARSAVKGPQR